jgi:hypothetical protein
VQCPLDSSAVILRKCADTVRDIVEIFTVNGLLAEMNRALWESGLRLPSEVHHDLDQIFEITVPVKGFAELRGHDAKKQFKIVRDFFAWQFTAPRSGLDLLT